MPPKELKMSSMRSFLVAALRDWVLANNMTPHIRAVSTHPAASLPRHLVSASDEVVFNVSPGAVTDFRYDRDGIHFGATFNRVYAAIFIPYDAIIMVYARETGHGMQLPPDPTSPPDDEGDQSGSGGSQKKKSGRSRDHLRVVK